MCYSCRHQWRQSVWNIGGDHPSPPLPSHSIPSRFMVSVSEPKKMFQITDACR
jgi:hypothetical protein